MNEQTRFQAVVNMGQRQRKGRKEREKAVGWSRGRFESGSATPDCINPSDAQQTLRYTAQEWRRKHASKKGKTSPVVAGGRVQSGRERSESWLLSSQERRRPLLSV